MLEYLHSVTQAPTLNMAFSTIVLKSDAAVRFPPEIPEREAFTRRFFPARDDETELK